MKRIKIAAGLTHVNYGKITGLAKEVNDARVDYVRPDAADMRDFQNMKLMGGHRIITGIRPGVDKLIRYRIYTASMGKTSIEQIGKAEADTLVIPTEHFIDVQLAYIISWCRERHIKVDLTLGCYTPLCLAEESIYDIGRLHIVTYGVDETDGKNNWGWRKSAIDLVQRARKMIDEKDPKCELAVDGDLRVDNMDKLIECNPDIIVLSGAIFKDPDRAVADMKECRVTIDTAAEKYDFE